MIYFDSAATTFQKPTAVSAAMREALTTMSSPGRGSYHAAMRAADMAFSCRNEAAELFHVENPEQVVFTMNATHGLNIAIKSLVPARGKVVISGYEHNAVTRPLQALGAEITVAEAPLFHQDAALEAFDHAIQPGANAVICNHVSNVFGFVQPLTEIAALCRSRNVPLIIDASQSAGILPLDMAALGAAFIAMPGHKGLYGPQGTGLLLCGESVPVATLIEGGTGSRSLEQEMPDFLPDRLESGTHNIPGIAGLLAGIRFARNIGENRICDHERKLALLMAKELGNISGVQVFSLPGLKNQIGVVSFVPRNRDVEEVGEVLSQNGVAVRTGFHCAPLAHRTAGTLETGTIRLSFSAFNTFSEVHQCLRIIREKVG